MKLLETVVHAGNCEGFWATGYCTSIALRRNIWFWGASPAEVDAALAGFGFAIGPFAAAKMAGLDIGWATRKRLASQRPRDPRVPYFPDRLCKAGYFGHKSGKGYYDHATDGRSPAPISAALELIATERADREIVAWPLIPDQIVRRFMAARGNELAMMPEDGIARRPLEIDVVLIAGYGFPRYRGGLCKWADLTGLKTVVSEIKAHAARDPELWKPAPLLKKLFAEGRRFDHLNR